MSSRPRITLDPSLTAIVTPRGGDVDMALWRRTADGPRLVRESTIPTAGLAAALEASAAGRRIVLLGSGQARCRVFELPKAPEAQLEAALRLQAESVQLGSVPPHRVGAALLPASGTANRSGVVIEWPTTETAPTLPAAVHAGQKATFAADVTALVGMACVPGVRGPLLFVDGARGIISFAIQTPRGLAMRSAREEPGEDAEAVVRLVAETALHHGVDAAALEAMATQVRDAMTASGGSGFGCSAADRAKLAAATGAPIDAAWWRQHALHAGVAIAATGPLLPLASLLEHEPGEEPDTLGRVLNRLSEPRVLTGVIIAAIAAIALGPLVISFVDYQVMRWKVSSVGADEFRGIVAANDRLIGIYKERATRTWPMTKLLADLACCTPEGIEFEQVTIVHDESVAVRGKARKNGNMSGPDLILRMEQLMQESGIFDKIIKGWDPPNQLTETQFTLSASITRPTHAMALSEEQDFGTLTLAERRYGPRAKLAPGDGHAVESAGSVAPSSAHEPGSEAAVADRAEEHAELTDAAASEAESARAARADAHGEAADGAPSASKPADENRSRPAPDGSTATAGATKPPTEGTEPAPGEGPAATGSGDAAGGRRAAADSARRPEDRNLASSTQTPAGNERAGRAGPASAEPEKAPDSPSDEQIAAMSKEEALSAASAIAKARGNPAFDEETKKRLKLDFDRLMAHIRSKSG